MCAVKLLLLVGALVQTLTLAEDISLATGNVSWPETGEEDIILPAIGDESLPERLLIMIPGGKVPNHYYKLPMEAIQKATTGLRLTIVLPAVPGDLCIATCPGAHGCFPLKWKVDGLIKKSGFKGQNPKEDTFVAGHSLGGTCAGYMVEGYGFAYAGLMLFGSYVDLTGPASVANFPIPVLHMSGEVDGGQARPGKMSWYYEQMRAFEKTHTTAEALKLKPVQVLEGMDHSDFCPGLFVTAVKDCKSEVTQDVAMQRIGEGASAFLHMNSPVAASTQAAGLETMERMLTFTAQMLDPYLKLYQVEQSGSVSPWCSKAQHTIVGLSENDADKLSVSDGGCSVVPGNLKALDQFHTKYTVSPGVGLEVGCGASVEASKNNFNLGSTVAAASIDCKLVDATTVAQQLKIQTNATVQCADINRQAVALAESLLSEKSRKRYEEKGRKYCFLPDAPGKAFNSGSLTQDETKDCMQVTALALKIAMNNNIDGCKLLSPALAMDWMMTDSHKPFPYPSDSESTLEQTTPKQPSTEVTHLGSHDSQCCLTCTAPQVKYYSVDTEHGHCGECCMQPKYYNVFKVFEPNLLLADGKRCSDFGYQNYDTTVTHGVWPVKMTLDLYDKPAPPAPDDSQCCITCTAPQVKYYSIDTVHGHCGECCMQPKNYKLFKVFEPNLLLADGKTCSDFGYQNYDSTVTHGVWPIKMTLDLYDKPASQFVVV